MTTKKIAECLENVMQYRRCSKCNAAWDAINPQCSACYHRQYRRKQKTEVEIKNQAFICADFALGFTNDEKQEDINFFKKLITIFPDACKGFDNARLEPYVQIYIDNLIEKYPNLDEALLYSVSKRMVYSRSTELPTERVIDLINKILDKKANNQEK